MKKKKSKKGVARRKLNPAQLALFNELDGELFVEMLDRSVQNFLNNSGEGTWECDDPGCEECRNGETLESLAKQGLLH